MAFTTSSNTNIREELKTNTKGKQFYSSHPVLGSTLEVNYWNNCLNFKINPLLDERKRTEKKMYDYESFIMTAFTPDNLMPLKMKLDEIVESVKEEDYSFKSLEIEIGKTLVQIGKLKEDNTKLVLALYHKSEEGEISGLTYVFNNKKVFRNFDIESKTFDTEYVQSEFMLFYTMVCETVKANTYAYAHANRYTNRYTEHYARENMKKVMNKLGIGSFSNSNGGSSRNEGFMNGVKNSNSSQDSSDINYGGRIDGGELPLDEE